MEKNNKENIKTQKDGRRVKLTINNAEVSSNRDIGMNMRQMNHVIAAYSGLKTIQV
jgi:hypothetical protein